MRNPEARVVVMMKRGDAMRTALAVLVLAVPVALAQDAGDKGEAIAKISVPGMECEGACPPTVKAALEGDGVKEVKVDFAKKTATVRFEPEKTSAHEALLRLTKMKTFAASKVVSLEAVLENDYARGQASAEIPKKGARGKVHFTLEPRGGHAFNAETGAPDLEVELKPTEHLHTKDPVVKVKGGLKASRTFDLEVDVDAKARSGETRVTIEVRLVDTKGGTSTPRVIDLTVPVQVP